MCCGKVSLKAAVTAIAVFEFVVIGAAVIGPWIAGQILQAVLTGVGTLLAPMILMYGARTEVNLGLKLFVSNSIDRDIKRRNLSRSSCG